MHEYVSECSDKMLTLEEIMNGLWMTTIAVTVRILKNWYITTALDKRLSIYMKLVIQQKSNTSPYSLCWKQTKQQQQQQQQQ